MARKKYLEENGLPLVVPEDIKYIVLRYCYWKGEKIQLYDESLFSQDRTIKLPLDPLNRTETVNLFGIPLIVEINGPKENPQVTLIDGNTNKQITTFTWFDENVILGEYEIDEEHADQIFIIGDFTTK